MKTLNLILIAALASACHKADSGGTTQASASGSSSAHAATSKLTGHIPAGAFAAFGYNRDASEADIKTLFKTATDSMEKAGMAPKIPSCPIEVFAKIDSAVGGVAGKDADHPDIVFAVHGGGLRAALDACFKTFPETKVADADGATGYTVGGGKTMYVTWLDGDTLVGGPVNDAKATAALAKAASSAPGAVLAHVDTGSPMWASMDLTGLPKDNDDHQDIPRPNAVWAQLKSGMTLTGTAKMASADDAKKLKGLIDQAIASGMVPPQAQAFVKDLKLEVSGDEVRATAPLGKAIDEMQKQMGGQKLPAAGSAAAIGVVAAIAVPMIFEGAGDRDSDPPVRAVPPMDDKQ